MSGELFHYVRTVFIAPPWEKIHVQYTERKQSYPKAVLTFHAMAEPASSHVYNA